MLLYGVFTTTYRNNGWIKVALLATITFILASCGAGRTTVSGNKTSTTLQDDIIQYGRQYLGKPYRYAGKGPHGFDCSGYTSFVFKKFGYRLAPSSAGQDKQTSTIARREDLRKGDLVFFAGNRKSGRVGHVGIVTEAFPNGQFKFIHSSTSNGVIVSSSTEPYYASRYLRGGRVLEENASYVTRRNPPAPQKQLATANKKSPQSGIPEIGSGKTVFPNKTTASANTTEYSEAVVQRNDSSEKGSIILVQTDPQKNPPLTSTTHGKGQNKDKLRQTKSDMALREEDSAVITPLSKNHTIQMGETLYSISQLYGCSVEQLKAWNPQLKSVLIPGEILLVYTNQPE